MNPSDSQLPIGDPTGSTILGIEPGSDLLLNAFDKVRAFLDRLESVPSEPSLIYSRDGENIEVQPVGDRLRIGRGATNDIYFTPPPDEMSRLHFTIEFNDGQPVLRDFSSNGTRVRGRKVKDMENECRVLVDGDFIEAAGVLFVYLDGTSSSEIEYYD